MENERNAQAAAQPAEEKKPVEEKKPGYPMHKRKYTPLYTIIVFLYGLLVKLLFFMKIEGRENVPKDRNCILMGNHQCLLDPVTLALCVPDREIHFMGKKELFENKALGWVFRQVHGFPVDRGNMDMGAIRTAMGVLKAGETLGIFPEGTRSKSWAHAAAAGRCVAAGAQERLRRGAGVHRGPLQAVSAHGGARRQAD